DLFLNLELEFIAGAPEFGEQLAHLSCDFRQLFRSDQDQRQNENEDGITEMHECSFIIPAVYRPHKPSLDPASGTLHTRTVDG
ncbi:MAG TPA: hypothetical protein VJU82_13015, partial [Acidobacteriaceae bacterium]|nr:hypothetical protein [Acidobacteriaceae bacterium]